MPDFPLTEWQIAGAVLAVLAGAYVQGCVGYGLGLVAVPVLAMIDPLLVPGPLIATSIALNIMIARADHREIHMGELRRAIVASIPGACIGAAILYVSPDTTVAIVIGVVTLLAVALSVSGWHAPPTYRNVTIAGFLSGMMGTASSIGGPPMAIVYSRETAAKLRGTLAGFFIAGSMIALVPLTFAGKMTGANWLCVLALLPGIAIGFGLARLTAKHVPDKAMRPLVLSVAGIGAVALIIKAAAG